MTTTSFPVVGDNIDHAQWLRVMAGADGIVDSDASSADREWFGLDLSDTGNTAKVKRGKYKLRGFVLQCTAAHGLTLAAAVGSPVVYTVGVMYDPALEADPAGPLYLTAQVKTALVIPSGGVYNPLYEVTRSPSQVLSQAAVVDVRRFVGHSVYLQPSFPLTGVSFPLGTVAYRNGERLVRVPDVAGTGTEWLNLSKPAWQNLSLPSSVRSLGAAVQYAKVNGITTLSGAWEKTDGSSFAPGGGTSGWYSLGSLPAGYRPGRTWTFGVDHGFDATATAARVQVLTDGTVRGQVGPAHSTTITGATGFIRADGVSFPAEG